MNAARIAAILVGSAAVIVGAVQASKPEMLGITPAVSAWLGVISALLGFWQMLLPPVLQSGSGKATDKT